MAQTLNDLPLGFVYAVWTGAGVALTALIGAAASLLCTVVVGALTFFMKKTLASLEEADKRNAEDIKTLDKNLNDLKADLPLIYVTREDYIRVMNRVEDKLDQILYGGKAKGKEE